MAENFLVRPPIAGGMHQLVIAAIDGVSRGDQAISIRVTSEHGQPLLIDFPERLVPDLIAALLRKVGGAGSA